MRLARSVLLASLGFSALALGQKVVYQFDRNISFAPFKTYKWITIEGGSTPDQMTAQNITTMVDAELAKKGLIRTSGDASLLVGYQTTLDKQRQLGWFNNGGPWTGGFNRGAAQTIEVGTLVIDVYDPSQKQLIWRGSATKTLSPSGNRGQNYETLQKAVGRLLKTFPPSGKA